MILNVIHFIDYLYFKLYRFAKFMYGPIPEISAIVVITILIFLPMNSLIWYLAKHFPNLDYFLRNIPHWLLYAIIGLYFIVVLLCFNKKERFKKIEERYQNENLTFRRVTDIVFSVLLIVYLWVINYVIIISCSIALLVLFIVRAIKKDME
jgi:hypothetical protein